MLSELGEKARRVLGLLVEQDLDAVVLRGPGAVAWWSGGGATHVLATPEVGVADIVIERVGDGVRTTVVTAVNEEPRLRAEELAGLEASWTVLAWSTAPETVLPAGPRVGSDVPMPGCRDLRAELARLRASLLPAEVERVTALGRDAAQALTQACTRVGPADSEWRAAAATGAALLERGIDPVVLLVAGAGRLPVHRHPLPTGAPLGDLAMLVACGRRGGLVVSLTRFVGTPTPELADRFDRLRHVDAAVNLATRPGRRTGEVFRDLQAAYLAYGFDDLEWTRHHQGGPTGYASRELLATADTPDLVVDRQLFAWNPSAVGVKCEDTVLTGPDGVRVLTVDPQWPVQEVGGLARPLVLPFS